MTRKLTQTRRRLKNRSKYSRSKRSHSRNNKYKKTRSRKYIKKRRNMTRRRVLRGGEFVFRGVQPRMVKMFFRSFADDKNESINSKGVPKYYAIYDNALVILDSLYQRLGKTAFIKMMGSSYFKKKYNSTFYNHKCLAKLRLMKWLLYIYAKVSNGSTIFRPEIILHFTPGRFRPYGRFKSSSDRFKSSRVLERSVIPVIMALLCSADPQCLNTTNYVTIDSNAEGLRLIAELRNNLMELISSGHLSENTRQYINEYVLPRIELNGKMLALNPTILCLIIKEILGIKEAEEEEAIEEEAAEKEEEEQINYVTAADNLEKERSTNME
uniref:Uncharacterized protein n=1 Tax=viral metagenome TaxID=1070528 RepID=A0A6C0EW59_9ZZZZ